MDSGNKIAVSAHGMGSGGLAVDAMAIGCLGVDRRVERFFSYLAISFHSTEEKIHQDLPISLKGPHGPTRSKPSVLEDSTLSPVHPSS